MNPSARLSVALVLGLVLWYPSLSASLRGEMDLPDAAIRYLVAFLFARVAVAGVSWLLHAYSAVDEADDGPTDQATDDGPLRRSDDVSAAAGLS
ncbi:MAG: hypothetical protein JWN67_2155 [Actinomycetia bacterium]|nr:hypothetical protein [Actinomycetes bacterium]